MKNGALVRLRRPLEGEHVGRAEGGLAELMRIIESGELVQVGGIKFRVDHANVHYSTISHNEIGRGTATLEGAVTISFEEPRGRPSARNRSRRR